ncbi:MAG: hypothetical protein WKF60_11430 [Ilumatobacter sp.]
MGPLPADEPVDWLDEITEARFVTASELRSLMVAERFLPTCDRLVLPLVPGFAPIT